MNDTVQPISPSAVMAINTLLKVDGAFSIVGSEVDGYVRELNIQLIEKLWADGGAGISKNCVATRTATLRQQLRRPPTDKELEDVALVFRCEGWTVTYEEAETDPIGRRSYDFFFSYVPPTG